MPLNGKIWYTLEGDSMDADKFIQGLKTLLKVAYVLSKFTPNKVDDTVVVVLENILEVLKQNKDLVNFILDLFGGKNN